LTTHHHLTPRVKKEYSYTSIPHLGLHGLFYGELYLRKICCQENLWRKIIYIKVKGPRNRLGVTQRVSGGLDSQIFMTFGT
jgi:hypothetical protein